MNKKGNEINKKKEKKEILDFKNKFHTTNTHTFFTSILFKTLFMIENRK